MPHCSLGDELQEPLSVPPFVEVLEDVVRDALRLADFLRAFATRMRSLPLTRVRTLAAALILA